VLIVVVVVVVVVVARGPLGALEIIRRWQLGIRVASH
jgi:hypothetical protein